MTILLKSFDGAREGASQAAANLDRLAVTGTLVAPRPIRRRYAATLLGWIALPVAAAGLVAFLALVLR